MHCNTSRASGLRPLFLGALLVFGLIEAAVATVIDKQPDASLLGTTVNAQFGGQLNAEADLNKDGYIDLIVGSPAGSDYQGAIDVFYGSRRGPSKTPDFHYQPAMSWTQAGSSPQALDVNGDGWLDLVVGASNYSGALPYTGAVLIFLGSASGFPAEPSQVIQGQATNGFFGFGVRSLGDFNGDGYADVVVSAQGQNNGLGRLYIYTGDANGLSSQPFSTLEGAAPWRDFGQVFDTGDTNGDGIFDIVVGRPTPAGGIPNMAWIYLGSPQGYTRPRIELMPVLMDNSDRFGDAVSMLGDVDGDGYADLAVGAPKHITDLRNGGLITLYFGSASGITSASRTQLVQPDSFNFGNFGGNFRGRRDVNRDGYMDLIVGTSVLSRPNDPTVAFPGMIWIYPGSPNGLRIDKVYKLPGQAGSREELGQTVEAGDLNGDGLMEILSGSPLYTDSLRSQGKLLVFRGAKPRGISH